MRQFAIFKTKEKKNENSPDYYISVKVGEKYVAAGGCWLKDSPNGKYFSCQLSEPYNDRPGFSIAVEEPKKQEQPEYPTSINPEDIPF